jgi:hypothetical protein
MNIEVEMRSGWESVWPGNELIALPGVRWFGCHGKRSPENQRSHSQKRYNNYHNTFHTLPPFEFFCTCVSIKIALSSVEL